MASKENIRKHREDIVKRWNANNTTKITTDNLTTAYSKQAQEQERKRIQQEQKRKAEEECKKKEAEAKKKKREEERKKRQEELARNNLRRTQGQNKSTRSKEHKSRANMSEEAEKIFYEEWNKHGVSRAILGTLEGATNATTGASTKGSDKVTEETKKSGAYKAGELVGQLGSYALGYGAAGGVAAKASGKLLTSGTGKALTSKLAKNKMVKEAAKKTLKKKGQNVTEKAVEHMARNTAKKIADGIAKNAIADATIGTVMDSNVARSKGYKVGSEEWNKEMALNAALNIGVGGAVEIAPTVAKALSNTKVAQNATEKFLRASDKVETTTKKLTEPVSNAIESKKADLKAKLPTRKKAETPAVKVSEAETVPEVPAVKQKAELPSKGLSDHEIFERTAPERFKTESVDEVWDENVDALFADSDFESAMMKEYGSPDNMETAAEALGLSINDFVKMKKTEFDKFGTLKANADQSDNVVKTDDVSLVDEIAERLQNAEQRASDTELWYREGDMAITRRGVKLPYEEWKRDRLAAIDELRQANKEFEDAVEQLPTPGVVKADSPEVPQRTARQQAYDDAVRQREDLMAKEIASNAEVVRNYKKQGTDTNFTPDRNRLEAGWEASDGFGFSTRSSANAQWYQDFYKQNGRAPNKSEAEAIAREHLENDLSFARNNPDSVGDVELGASSELREADRKIAQMEWEDEAINTYRTEPADTDWTIESGELMGDVDFQHALEKQYKSPDAMEAVAMESGLSKNDWLRMKYDEFYQFGKIDAMDPIKETATKHEPVGGFEVEGSNDGLGIISKDFMELEDTFERMRGWTEKFRKQFVTGQQELERMAKVSGSDRTLGYTQAVRNSNGVMSYIFSEKLVDSAGKVLDDMSYKKLIDQIPTKDMDDFNTYAQHLHNIDRIAVDPKKAVFRQTTALESAAIVEDMLKKHPEFEKYSESITKWWNKFTKAWLVDTGRMTQEAYDAMISKYPNYIPTYREDKANAFGSLANRITAGKAVGGAVGGTSKVIPLQDNFLREMSRIVTSTRKNDLYATIIDELRKNPEDLKQFGVAVDDAPAVLGDDIDDFLTNIEREGLKQVHDKVAQVTAYVDGKPVSAYINNEMLDSLKLLDNVIDSKNLSLFVSAGKAITNPIKAGITGLNPLFALANAMRDLPTLYIQSANNPWKTTYNVAKAIGEIARHGERYELYKALGGKQSGYFAQGKGFKDIKDYTSNPLRKAWRGVESALSALGETTETIPRLAEFISTIEKYGGDKDAAMKALYDAGEVTVNFSRSAPATKVLDSWTLYLNAAVQGLDKFARTVKAHPGRTAMRSATAITVPYAALMMANHDNPHYQNLNERTKQNYFCVPNYFGEKDAEGNAMTFIKVPLNREYGALFGSMLDVIGGYIDGEENPWEGMQETLTSNFLPPNPLTDNVLAPIAIDLPNNKDFAGRSIVPTNLLNASPINQYDANTSGAAMGMATVANNLSERLPIGGSLIPEALKSPKKVDFLLDSYAGYLGSVAQSATARGAETPGEVLKENILQGTIIDPFKDRFTADSRYSSGILEDFYNEMAELETGKVDEGLEDSKGVNYVKYKAYTEISEQLTELSKKEKEILGNNNLSKEQKEKQISSLRATKNRLARSAKTEAAKAEKEYNQAPDYAILPANVKEKWSSSSGVGKQEFAKAQNSRTITSGKKAALAGAMEMYSSGSSYKAASLVDKDISEDVWNNARNLASSGISPSQLQMMASDINTDGNTYYSNDEIMNYLNNSNYSQTQKAYIFAAFARKGTYNPY